MPNTANITGLAPDTPYRAYAVHVDDWGNTSPVGVSVPFTTPAATATELVASVSEDYESNTQTGHTFPAVSLGSPAANRRIIAFIVTAAFGAIPSAVTIGGVTAAKLPGIDQNPQFGNYLTVWEALVPDGETGSIVVTGDGRAYGAEVFAAYGKSVANSSGHDVSGTSISLDLNVQDGDDVIACTFSPGGTAFTWAGLTEDHVFDIRSAEWVGAASAPAVPAATPRTITATIGISEDFCGIALALR